jgi:outer membrane lipoprotein SlyB
VEKTMSKKFLSAALAIATVASGLAATPAAARHGSNDGYYSYDRRDDRNYSYDRRDNRRDDRNYRYRGRSCDRGTGGTVIGAVVGGLAGREVARRGNRTEGTIIGAAVGALAGRAIDKSDSSCRRR